MDSVRLPYGRRESHFVALLAHSTIGVALAHDLNIFSVSASEVTARSPEFPRDGAHAFSLMLCTL